MRSVGLEVRAGIAALALGVLSWAVAGETATAEEAHPGWQAPGLHLGGVRLGMRYDEAAAAWARYAQSLDPRLRAAANCEATVLARGGMCRAWKLEWTEPTEFWGVEHLLGPERGFVASVVPAFVVLGDAPPYISSLSARLHAPEAPNAAAVVEALEERFGAPPTLQGIEEPPTVDGRPLNVLATLTWLWDTEGEVIRDYAKWKGAKATPYDHALCTHRREYPPHTSERVLASPGEFPDFVPERIELLETFLEHSEPPPRETLAACPPRVSVAFYVGRSGEVPEGKSLSALLASLSHEGQIEVVDDASCLPGWHESEMRRIEDALRRLREGLGSGSRADP